MKRVKRCPNVSVGSGAIIGLTCPDCRHVNVVHSGDGVCTPCEALREVREALAEWRAVIQC